MEPTWPLTAGAAAISAAAAYLLGRRRRARIAAPALPPRREEALQRILRASAELKPHLPLDAVLANVARAAASSLGYRAALLSLYDRAEGVLVPRAHAGLGDAWPRLEPLRLPSDGAPGGEPPSPLATVLPPGEAGGVVRVPLESGGPLVGLLELAGPEEESGDRVVLELFASQAVTAIRLARAHETTRLGSIRDPLTGVANHGHFQETLYRELSRHERRKEPLALLLVDLDDFKKVNDRHGHPVGDAVLKGVVARLLGSVREMDTVARYGGEEFAVILPETDGRNGWRVAERLRAAVAASPVEAGLAGPLPVTISAGLAVYPEDAASKAALVECADKALYAAKRTGKDRVVRYSRVPVSPDALLTGRA